MSLHDLRDQLLSVRETRGSLTPAIVVEEATADTHPLHSRFEWNDEVAGHNWRLEQARDLIQSVRVTYREGRGKAEPRMVRAFVSVPSPDGRAYEPVEVAAADPMMRAVVLSEMEREWKQLKARYQHFAEFSALVLTDLQERAA